MRVKPLAEQAVSHPPQIRFEGADRFERDIDALLKPFALGIKPWQPWWDQIAGGGAREHFHARVHLSWVHAGKGHDLQSVTSVML